MKVEAVVKHVRAEVEAAVAARRNRVFRITGVPVGRVCEAVARVMTDAGVKRDVVDIEQRGGGESWTILVRGDDTNYWGRTQRP